MVAACTDSSEVRAPEATPTLPPETTATLPPVTTDPTTTAPITTTTESTRTWTLLAGGDVLMERSERLGMDPFASITPPLGSVDLSVVNVEMAISDRGTPHHKTYVFRAPPSAAGRIANGGVRVANLANNHAMDYGADALSDTIDLLEGAGVVTVGAGRDIDEAYRYRILTTAGGLRRGLRRSLPDRSLQLRGRLRPRRESHRRTSPTWPACSTPSGPPLSPLTPWSWWSTGESSATPAQPRRSARSPGNFSKRAQMRSSATIPHVLQPVVFTGEKLVAFSLGNFIWEPRENMSGETGVLQIDFDGDAVVGWAFHPHLLDVDGVPVPVDSGPRVDRIRDIISGDCGPHAPPLTTTTLPPPTGTAGI